MVALGGARGATRRGCGVTADAGRGPCRAPPVVGATVSSLSPSLFPTLSLSLALSLSLSFFLIAKALDV
jgi:hypothetical protein